MDKILERYAAWLENHHGEATLDDQHNKFVEEVKEVLMEQVFYGLSDDKSVPSKEVTRQRYVSECADVIFVTMGLILKLGDDPGEVLKFKMDQLEARDVSKMTTEAINPAICLKC